MKTRFLAAYWGHPSIDPVAFLDAAQAAGYAGVEIHLPDDADFEKRFLNRLQHIRGQEPEFILGLQLVPPFPGSWQAEKDLYQRSLERLASFEPHFINAHTGRDFYRFEENAALIDVAEALQSSSGIPVFHETHRGRFSFHLPGLMPYLDTFPQLAFVADLSHFCTVSESMLEGQDEFLERLLPRVRHLHARVGHEHGPQASHPAAPEWQGHAQKFLGWWQAWRNSRIQQGADLLTLTPEFGPAPYLPTEPFSQQPFITSAAANAWMREYLIEHGF